MGAPDAQQQPNFFIAIDKEYHRPVVRHRLWNTVCANGLSLQSATQLRDELERCYGWTKHLPAERLPNQIFP